MPEIDEISQTSIMKCFVKLENGINSLTESIEYENIIPTLISNKKIPKSDPGRYELIMRLAADSGILVQEPKGKFKFQYSSYDEIYKKFWDIVTSDEFAIRGSLENVERPEVPKKLLEDYLVEDPQTTNRMFKEYFKVALSRLKKASESNMDLYDFYVLVRSLCSERMNENAFSTFILSVLHFFGITEYGESFNYEYHSRPGNAMVSRYRPDLYNYKLQLTKLGSNLV